MEGVQLPSQGIKFRKDRPNLPPGRGLYGPGPVFCEFINTGAYQCGDKPLTYGGRLLMPRIKRWFPVSHDINHDPEVIELTETYGDWMLRVWLQMLSIADRNEGEIQGTAEWIATSFAHLWGSNSRRYNTEWRRNKLLIVFEWMSNKSWIKIESDKFIVCNYAKYHPSREMKQSPPSLTSFTSLTDLKEEKNKKPPTAAFAPPDWIKIDTWESFKEMRKKERHPLTEKASTLVVSQLEKLRDRGHDPNECLERSIMNGWRGVFPPDERHDRSKANELEQKTRALFAKRFSHD